MKIIICDTSYKLEDGYIVVGEVKEADPDSDDYGDIVVEYEDGSEAGCQMCHGGL